MEQGKEWKKEKNPFLAEKKENRAQRTFGTLPDLQMHESPSKPASSISIFATTATAPLSPSISRTFASAPSSAALPAPSAIVSTTLVHSLSVEVSKDGIVVSSPYLGERVILTADSIDRLTRKAWLNDEIINFYLM